MWPYLDVSMSHALLVALERLDAHGGCPKLDKTLAEVGHHEDTVLLNVQALLQVEMVPIFGKYGGNKKSMSLNLKSVVI